jgi:CMP-N-acetylneuraminic acid synthetase
MKTAAYIPVRGGSKGIPNKNIKPLAGRPLLYWATAAALAARSVDTVTVGTDSDAIADTARALFGDRISVFRRGPETCTDTASTEAALLEFAASLTGYTHVLLVQATSPLILGSDIDAAIAHGRAVGADSMLALVRQLKFVWRPAADGAVEPINYDPAARPRRQEFQGLLTEPGAFYLSSIPALIATGCRLHGKVAGYELAEENYFDLDTELEWRVVEALLAERLDAAGNGENADSRQRRL